MKRVLITGGTGFIGSEFVRQYRESHSVLTVGRRGSDILWDFLSPEPEFPHVDEVYYLAGCAHVNPTHRRKGDFEMVNHHFLKTLLNVLARRNCFPNVAYASSVSVYGISQGNLIDETSTACPVDEYGMSKLQGEQFLKNWAKREGVKIALLRLPLVFDWNAPGNLHRLESSFGKRWFILPGNCRIARSIVYRRDLPKAFFDALRTGGTFNLTDGANPTVFDLIMGMARKLGKSRPRIAPTLVGESLVALDRLMKHFGSRGISATKLLLPLTFSDNLARQSFDWRPTPVLSLLD